MQQSCEELEQVRRRSEENDGYEWEHFKSWSKRSLERSRPKWWVLKENCAFPSYSFPLLPVLSSLSVGTCSFLRLRESPLTWIPGDSALCLAWCVDILIQNFFKGNLCSCHCLEQEIHKVHEEGFFIVQKNSVQKAIPALIVLWACHCGGWPQPASIGNIESEKSVQYPSLHVFNIKQLLCLLPSATLPSQIVLWSFLKT